MAFHKEMKSVKLTAWLICAILIVRLFVIVCTTFTMTRGRVGELTIDIIAILIYVIIILLGTRAKKQSNT
jgi:hypothetical protein